MNKLLFICGVVLLVGSVAGQSEEGDSCVDQSSGQRGICTGYRSCPSAKEKWDYFGIRPTICGNRYEVVCCQQYRRRPTPTRRPPKIVKRISQLKCEEYSKFVTKTEEFLPLSAGAKPINLTVPRCTYKKNTLIVGGDPALPGEFPHMAALGWPSLQGYYLFKCGGTLISEKYVLTAAHCSVVSSRDTDTTSDTPTVVRLGDHDLRDEVKDGAKPITVGIKNIIKHPNFKAVYYDISLVELDEVLEFNSYIRPACLWQKQEFDGMGTGIVTGWGAIAYNQKQSDVLLKVTIDLLSNDQCDPLLSALHNRKWSGFTDNQLCAGDLTGKHDSCQGDSGGPLVLSKPENDCIFYVTGITSYGYKCGQVNGPGIYTRVASFVPWIESIVWPK